jgi:hypothetical protein
MSPALEQFNDPPAMICRMMSSIDPHTLVIEKSIAKKDDKGVYIDLQGNT